MNSKLDNGVPWRSVVILAPDQHLDLDVLQEAGLAPPKLLSILSVGWPQTAAQRASVDEGLAFAALRGLGCEARLVLDMDDALDSLLPGDELLRCSPSGGAGRQTRPGLDVQRRIRVGAGLYGFLAGAAGTPTDS